MKSKLKVLHVDRSQVFSVGEDTERTTDKNRPFGITQSIKIIFRQLELLSRCIIASHMDHYSSYGGWEMAQQTREFF